MGFGMANKKEYKQLYNKLKREFEVEKDLEINQKLHEKESRNEKKVKRLIETQKGLMRELKLLRERRDESILMGEELEKEKELGLKLQIKNLGKKYNQQKKNFEKEKSLRETKENELDKVKSQIIELENQNFDFRNSMVDRTKEINLLKESTRFLETKIGKLEHEKEDLMFDLNSKETLKRELVQMSEEVQKKDEDLRNMKVSLYEVEVNEKILLKQNNDEKQRNRDLKNMIEQKEQENMNLEREIKMINVRRDELDRELRMRKGAGIIEEEKQKLHKEMRQFQEFSKQKDYEIEDLRNQVSDMKDERLRIERFYKDKRNEKESLLENEIKDWERDVGRKDQKILDLEFERNICNRELEEKNKEIERLRADMQKYRKMEEEFLRTVQMMNEEQERESIRSQRTRELDETRDNLIRKLKRRVKNEEIQNNLMQRTNENLVKDVDRLRSEKLKYLELIKTLKQKVMTRTEPKVKKIAHHINIESDDSIDVGLLRNENYIQNNIPESSFQRRHVLMQNLQSIQSEEFQRNQQNHNREYKMRYVDTEEKSRRHVRYNLKIANNKGFMFKSNAASFKGLTSGLVSDTLGGHVNKTDEMFELKKELVMKDKRVHQLENVITLYIFLYTNYLQNYKL